MYYRAFEKDASALFEDKSTEIEGGNNNQTITDTFAGIVMDCLMDCDIVLSPLIAAFKGR
jgi:hypothetical protein